MLIDMHSHLSAFSWDRREDSPGDSWIEREKEAKKELGFRRRAGILSFFSGGRPVEWEGLTRLGREESFWKSFGIHPWYADRYELEDLLPYVNRCDALGEMGMDSVWCQVELSVQRRLLERQLLLAADLKKPVILHTKGQEAPVASLLRDFPGKACVHWYSGPEKDLDAYLEMDCYFTLGPDTAMLWEERPLSLSWEEKERASAWRRMLRRIPVNRLFLETDGIDAVAWALGKRSLPYEALERVLQENLFFLAQEKGLSPAELEKQMERNLWAFMGRPRTAEEDAH